MRVLCLGDSLTEGTVGVGFIPFLAELLPGNEYVNLGVNGETMSGLRRRTERLASSVRGDTAIVWIGTNDVLMYPDWADHAEFAAADYEAILRLAADRAGKVLAVPPLLADPALAREHLRSYSSATVLVRDSSVLVRAVYVDIQSAFARFPGIEFTIDGAHLNNAGARLAAEVLSERLRTVLA
jgi:lysophospholipase L1-like esterase